MKRNDCYISGTRKETTFFKEEDILRNGSGNEKSFPLSLPRSASFALAGGGGMKLATQISPLLNLTLININHKN